ncbi:MAG: DUF1464 family protein [Desulfurococcaceae archaeon]
MVKVVGIDPGSKSMDVCMLCDGKVCYEKSYETAEVARNPELLVREVQSLGSVDLIALPSGYGVEVTRISDIPEDLFEEWYYLFILVTRKKDILEAIENGIVGARVYYAMAEFAKAIRRMNVPGVFIPGIINLPTVPVFRKINKIDMGTADKLSVAVLGIHEVAEKYGRDYNEVNYIHLEVGFGYAAAIAVSKGKIVDAYGGTTMPGPAFLTTGSLDLEVAQVLERFSKKDVFTTGCSQLAEVHDVDKWIEEYDEKAGICFEAFLEALVKATYSLTHVVKSPLVILLSGRLARSKKLLEHIDEKLGDIAPVERMRGLPGAVLTKETAQGYAVVADGLSGGVFKQLVQHVEIPRAAGSSLDYILIKEFFETTIGKSFVKLRSLLKSPAFNLRWWGIETSG